MSLNTVNGYEKQENNKIKAVDKMKGFIPYVQVLITKTGEKWSSNNF